jgi:hypothetical protein
MGLQVRALTECGAAYQHGEKPCKAALLHGLVYREHMPWLANTPPQLQAGCERHRPCWTQCSLPPVHVVLHRHAMAPQHIESQHSPATCSLLPAARSLILSSSPALPQLLCMNRMD